MNMKYTEKPVYNTVNVIGKTVDTVTGTIDRKTVGRCLITEEAGFGAEKDFEVVNGDGTVIRTAAKAEEAEVFIQLVGGKKSLASWKFFDAYKAENKENAGVTDVFTTEGDKILKVIDCAKRMCSSCPECDGQWMIVDKDGKRVFLRKIETGLSETGMVSC